jgi:hypothetical protein
MKRVVVDSREPFFGRLCAYAFNAREAEDTLLAWLVYFVGTLPKRERMGVARAIAKGVLPADYLDTVEAKGKKVEHGKVG